MGDGEALWSRLSFTWKSLYKLYLSLIYFIHMFTLLFWHLGVIFRLGHLVASRLHQPCCEVHRQVLETERRGKRAPGLTEDGLVHPTLLLPWSNLIFVIYLVINLHLDEFVYLQCACVCVCVRVWEREWVWVRVKGMFLYMVIVSQAPHPQWYLCIIWHMLVGTNYYTSNQSSLAR